MVQAMSDFMLGPYANIHRGVYHDSLKSTELFENAREELLSFFGGNSQEDVLIFTRNATDAVNVTAFSIFEPYVKEGDTILLTVMEHHANLVPWQVLAKRKKAKLAYVSLTDDHQLDLQEFEKACKTHKPAVAAFSFISNVLGTINPVQSMAKMAHQQGSKVLVDAAQAGMHESVQFNLVDSDVTVMTAHKMLGPTGIGCLIAKRNLLEKAEPYQFGGDMIAKVDYESSTWNTLPNKFEAGTPPIAEVVGWAAACAYLEELGWPAIHEHEHLLLSAAYERLKQMKGVTLYGPKDPNNRSSVISFNIKGVHAHDVGTILDQEGVAVRVGHHCAQILMKTLKVPATVRMSVGVYTTIEDIDAFESALKKVYEVFRL